MSISVTPSAHFVEKLDNWKQKDQTGNFAMFENLATAAGDEVNVDIASKVVCNSLDRCVRNFCCTFWKSSKLTWIW